MPDAPKQFRPQGHKPAQRKPWQQTKDLRKGFRGAKRMEAKKRILERDGYVCQNPQCGCLLEGMKDSILDHIIPLSRGGTHDDENLQSLCLDCSRKKTHKESRGE